MSHLHALNGHDITSHQGRSGGPPSSVTLVREIEL